VTQLIALVFLVTWVCRILERSFSKPFFPPFLSYIKETFTGQPSLLRQCARYIDNYLSNIRNGLLPASSGSSKNSIEYLPTPIWQYHSSQNGYFLYVGLGQFPSKGGLTWNICRCAIYASPRSLPT
jgi:hypothetical protein